MDDERTGLDPDVEKQVDQRLLRTALEQMRRGRDQMMREVADDLLEGRVALADIGNSAEVAQALRVSVRRYKDWRENIAEEDFQALMTRVGSQVEMVRRQVEQDRDHG
ncbi:hypothetical protein [Catellatospora chokoriensis]|uniref:Uncharacterized protein n=1 Tax=Catellatospora chokoriensis TaxID=310353 RepID=A0A8J3K4A4_9ACTN|nr:hypothetical protein [Catellatospora chokoriensis]GIF90450.1 hypothetical protein Cch02nite_38940 [Catellatospora chokoriensis]